MSVRSKRIEALRCENPNLSEEQLRKKERERFHNKGRGGKKSRQNTPKLSAKRSLVPA